ncbi:MAG TPA: amidohydrolase family protein [Mycobacteriales bacterium]|nr:amidohydrolase family protein [Mycobacteriales bacterium]
MTSTMPAQSETAAIKARLSHPVIDIDGHCMESLHALAPYLRDEGVDPASPSFRRLLPGLYGPEQVWSELTPRERHRLRSARPPWWGAPAANTLDLATALNPRLMYERLPEFGIDFSVVYPSLGLVHMHLEDEHERVGACRALNRYNADAFAGLEDRMTPVAAIPMHSPEEALTALDHAVQDLGYKAVLLAGYVQRPAAALAEKDPELARYAMWLDFYGIDSEHDYDPVWQRCLDLKVAVAFHSGSIGWGARRSTSSYMYNHLGHLAEGHHSLAKSLFLGGVTRRFPQLPFAFLEGGVAWAVALYADLVGHWEKRNVEALAHLDPKTIDRQLLMDLWSKHASQTKTDDGPPLPRTVRPGDDPTMLDEFARCEITAGEDIKALFADNFFFGCEADDPLAGTAFNTKANPYGATLKPMFGSDLSHWDVPDMRQVLEEAWELVEHEILDEAGFRDFVFANPVRFFTRANPSFFAGTTVESSVSELTGAEAWS